MARKRWICPLCENGVLAPSRPRKNNVLRYCLPCSEKTGKLVERTCPALDAKREAKAERKRAKAAKRPAKPRQTKRAFMREERCIIRNGELSFNFYEVAEKMCKSSRWERAVNSIDSDLRKAPEVFWSHSKQLRRLWERAVDSRGKSYIVLSRNTRYSVGTGAAWHSSLVVRAAKENPVLGDVLETMLHELSHLVHGWRFVRATVNGVRRPHDLTFNKILCTMARYFWGYPKNPYEAGFSVGRGYAPSRDLSQWLQAQIEARNPRVMRWLTTMS